MEPKLLIGYAVLFVCIVVSLGIGTQIVRDTQESQWATETGTYFDNRTVAAPLVGHNVSVGTDAGREQCVFTLASCAVYRGNDSEILTSDNYTITEPTDCTLYLELTDLYNATSLNVTCPYTRIAQDALYNVTWDGATATQDFAGWLPTVALVLVAMIVVGIVATFLIRRLI